MTTLLSAGDPTRRGLWRSRWAAIGAAVAVSLGAGGFFVAQAAPGSSESTIVTVSPERIMDTRNGNDLGLPGPFVSAVSQKLPVTGPIPTATGTKTVVPAGATGVLLNVTPVGPTAGGFISIRPGNASGAATTSSLNFPAGGVLPNAVQVALPTAGADAGKIDITYDAYGVAGPTTDILIDVVGYMTSAGLQELIADVATKAKATSLSIARSAMDTTVGYGTGASRILISVTINAPVAGLLQINASTSVSASGAGIMSCWLTLGAGATNNAVNLQQTDRWEFFPGAFPGTCSTNGAVAVASGTHVVNLVSDASNNYFFSDTGLDVIFVPGGTVTLATTLTDAPPEPVEVVGP